MRHVSVVAIALILSATAALAQDKKDEKAEVTAPSGATPTKITFTQRSCATGDTEQLAAQYDDGSKWSELQDELERIIESCDLSKPDADVTTVVTFIAGETPYTVLVPSTQPYALTMLGKKQIRVVVLVNGDAAASVPTDFKFMSKQIDDPVLAAIPSFVRAVTDAAGKESKVLSVRPPPEKAAPPMVGYVTQVSVPFSRASIAESGTVEVKVKTEIKKVAVSATFANTPRRKVALSTVAGGLIGSVKGPERMKVESGAYASDPLGRAVTMAAVMFHKPFDSTLSNMSVAERLAGYLGAVLTPAAGVGAGVSIGIIRGLSANVGYAWVWVPTSANGGAAGTAAPTGARQLSHKMNHGWFIGGGYVFKAD